MRKAATVVALATWLAGLLVPAVALACHKAAPEPHECCCGPAGHGTMCKPDCCGSVKIPPARESTPSQLRPEQAGAAVTVARDAYLPRPANSTHSVPSISWESKGPAPPTHLRI